MHAINSLWARPPSRPRVTIRAGGALATAGIVALLVGCGGTSSPGVAHTGSTASSTGRAAARVSGPKSPVAYAACMRSHGVPGFPDPGRSGRFSLGSSIDPSSPQFQAAQKACQSLLSTGGSSFATQAASGTISPEKQAQLLRFARCMRSHGVPSFPDPTSQGIALSSSVDPKSPQFQVATQACRQLLPALGQGGAQTTAAGSGGGS
jgi:hypothetical protein